MNWKTSRQVFQNTSWYFPITHIPFDHNSQVEQAKTLYSFCAFLTIK